MNTEPVILLTKRLLDLDAHIHSEMAARRGHAPGMDNARRHRFEETQAVVARLIDQPWQAPTPWDHDDAEWIISGLLLINEALRYGWNGGFDLLHPVAIGARAILPDRVGRLLVARYIGDSWVFDTLVEEPHPDMVHVPTLVVHNHRYRISRPGSWHPGEPTVRTEHTAPTIANVLCNAAINSSS
jgi:hypothetical protein